MIYSDADFCIFFAIVFCLYLLLKSYNLRFALLLVASLIFYAWAGLFDTAIFLFVVMFSWLAVYLARRYPKKEKHFIVMGVAVMALHLFFWKYASWLTKEIQNIWPTFLDGRKVALPLPVGISFFTLQGIAYLIDYRRSEAKFMNLKEYMLFKSFFAQLVAGPIVRSYQLLPQLKKLTSPSSSSIGLGLSLFAMGFFKKIVIADRIAALVDPVFLNPSAYNRSTLLLALLGYTAQIWSDFSGYTDMGRGTAAMLGIWLPENFLSPYLARTPSEFWRRWHITLSQWIRDYLYIPMGGSRGGPLKVMAVLIATMSISGLWHGANWTFLVWGLYHGILLAGERLLKKGALARLFTKTFSQPLRDGFLLLMMLSFTIFGWLIFRIQNRADFFTYLNGLIHNTGTLGFSMNEHIVTHGFLICMAFQIFFYMNLERSSLVFLEPLSRWFQTRRPMEHRLAGVCLGSGLALILVLSLYLRFSKQTHAFIYFQF
jgi:alginate O-acetyltransferase complex protein AlgI